MKPNRTRSTIRTTPISDTWDFSFAVQGLTEEQAFALGDDVMTVLCGGGKVRHSWIGRRLLFLGCKRLVIGSEKPRNTPPTEEVMTDLSELIALCEADAEETSSYIVKMSAPLLQELLEKATAAESLLSKAARVVEALDLIVRDGEGVSAQIVRAQIANELRNTLTPEDREALKGWAQ